MIRPILCGLAAVFPIFAMGAMSPQTQKPYLTTSAERTPFIVEGAFVGGETSVTSAKLKNIRRARTKNGERIVFDLEPQSDGKAVVPYFRVEASPKENRLVLSIWADVLYDFNANQVQKAFAKSRYVRRLNVVPRVEDGIAIVELAYAPKKKVKAFPLSNPARIVVDLL